MRGAAFRTVGYSNYAEVCARQDYSKPKVCIVLEEI